MLPGRAALPGAGVEQISGATAPCRRQVAGLCAGHRGHSARAKNPAGDRAGKFPFGLSEELKRLRVGVTVARGGVFPNANSKSLPK